MRLFRREPFLGFRARVLFAFFFAGGGGRMVCSSSRWVSRPQRHDMT